MFLRLTTLLALLTATSPIPPVARPDSLERPVDVAASPDGKTLYVALEQAPAIAVVDPTGQSPARRIDCPATPSGLCLLADGKTLAVTCGAADGLLALIDLASGQVVRRIPVGHSPRSPVASPDGKTLYVCNRFDGSISILDLEAGKEARRFQALREPFDAALSPDGKTLIVANLLPAGPADQGVVAASLTMIDTTTGQPRHIPLPSGSTAVRGVAITPDGSTALAVHILARFNLPTTQLDRGWMTSSALTLLDLPSGQVRATVLLDELDRGAANPSALAVTPDGASVIVAHAGTHELSVIEWKPLLDRLAAPSLSPSSDLAFLVGIRQRVPLGDLRVPTALALAGDRVIVTASFSDALAVVSLADRSVVTLPLGNPPVLTEPERGELLFHDATLSFQGWQSCASCHPDARVDALNWDLLNDGLGNPKNTKSLLLAHQTPPSMFLGVRADASTAVRAGFEHILFSAVVPEDALAVDAYLKSLKPVPGPASSDSASVERGRALFDVGGLGCASCHPAPLYTDLLLHDVASASPRDRQPTFDTPTLVELWRTAPYLHDGRLADLESLFRDGKHGLGSREGKPLEDQELADLIAFLRTL